MKNKDFNEPDFKALFEGLPGLYLVLDPNLQIVTASDAYLQATLTSRKDIIGKYFFDVFPDNPDDPSEDAEHNSHASFNRVLQNHVSDAMAVQRCDVRKPESEGGGFETRFWSQINSPVLNSDGTVAYIIHHVENVTDFMLLKQQEIEQSRLTDAQHDRLMQIEADLYTRSYEAAEANLKLKIANSGQEHLLDLVHVLIRDLNDCIISWNTGAEMLYGFTKDEAIGQVSHNLLKTVFPISVQSMTETIITTGSWQGQLIHTAKDGHKIIVASHQVLHRDDEGDPLVIIEVNNDITEQMRIEKALIEAMHETEKRTNELQIILDAVPAAVWIAHDTECLKITGNLASAEMLKVTRDSNMSKSAPKEELPDTFRMFRNGQEMRPEEMPVQLASKGETINNFDFEFHYEDGTIRYMMGNASPLLDEQGNPRGAVAAFIDITGRKQAEQALFESEEYFRTMIDAISQLAWMANPDGYIFWYNKRWYEYTGTTSEQMEGWGWQSVHDPEMLPKVLKRWNDSISTGEPFDMEFPLLGADGKFRTFLTRVMPMKDPEGRLIRWFGTNTDVSEAREAEAHKQEFYRLTILAATEGKLFISEKQEIEKMAGIALASWQADTPSVMYNAIQEAMQIAAKSGMDENRLFEFRGCITEAMANVVKHAKGGLMTLHKIDDSLIALISDTGPGIGTMALPKLALTKYYSTAGTLGMGFKLMIHFADRIYLATGPEGSTVAVEMKIHKNDAAVLNELPKQSINLLN